MGKELEHADRHWYLVSYDIRDQRRWRKAYKVLCGTGEWGKRPANDRVDFSWAGGSESGRVDPG